MKAIKDDSTALSSIETGTLDAVTGGWGGWGRGYALARAETIAAMAAPYGAYPVGYPLAYPVAAAYPVGYPVGFRGGFRGFRR